MYTDHTPEIYKVDISVLRTLLMLQLKDLSVG